MTFQIDDFLHEYREPDQVEVSVHEEFTVNEKIGFVDGLDLITLREKLRKHGVEI